MTTTSHRILRAYELRDIDQSLLPAVVLTDSLRTHLGYTIKQHSHGYYNHACWMIRPGVIASQDWTFKTFAVKRYLDKKHRVKVWVNTDWSNYMRARMLADIQDQLDERLYKRLYDVLGVLGQAIRIRSINIPWLYYCSERVEKTFKVAEPGYPITHSTPADLNAWMKTQEGFQVFGLFDPDLTM